MTKAALCSPLRNSDSQTQTARYVGIDEAGYGPNLGPLVVCCVAFRGPISLRDACWWRRLHPVVTRCNADGAFRVDDSKRILAGRNGRQFLESTVHAFLQQAGCGDFRLNVLVETLDCTAGPFLRNEHWFDGEEEPTPAVQCSQSLQKQLAACRLQLCSVQARILFPGEFNRRLALLGNKAAVELEVVRELLAPHLCPEQNDDVFVTVDRLGGRRYYRTVLEDLAGSAFLQTIDENPTASSYCFADSAREAHISFEVQADSRHLTVALASMIAKYLRERCMGGFNGFWTRHMPDVAPTAGYPGDSTRFLKAVEPALKKLAIPMSDFWRER